MVIVEAIERLILGRKEQLLLEYHCRKHKDIHRIKIPNRHTWMCSTSKAKKIPYLEKLLKEVVKDLDLDKPILIKTESGEIVGEFEVKEPKQEDFQYIKYKSKWDERWNYAS